MINPTVKVLSNYLIKFQTKLNILKVLMGFEIVN